MMGSKHERLSIFELPSGRLLAILLVGALPLCHVIFGDLRLCPASQVSASYAPKYPTCHHPKGAGYFAVLIAPFLGLLLKGAWLRYRVAASFSFKRHLHLFGLYPSKRPTAPLTQVFRM